LQDIFIFKFYLIIIPYILLELPEASVYYNSQAPVYEYKKRIILAYLTQ